MRPCHIGIDLDNTIINYDSVFDPVAQALGILEPGPTPRGKEDIKAQLIEIDSSETLWMRLQGQVYGRHIDQARPFSGVVECFGFVRAKGARISIVSHKTRHGHFDAQQVDLWNAARSWLTVHGFFELRRFGLTPADVHFEETRDAKVARIAAIGCDIFIDDLPEVLHHPQFPPGVKTIWFARDRAPALGNGLVAHRTWRDIMDNLAEKL